MRPECWPLIGLFLQVGRGLFSFITYRVYTYIGLDKMAKNEFTVYRRYRDFLRLHEKLEDRSVKHDSVYENTSYDQINSPFSTTTYN